MTITSSTKGSSFQRLAVATFRFSFGCNTSFISLANLSMPLVSFPRVGFTHKRGTGRKGQDVACRSRHPPRVSALRRTRDESAEEERLGGNGLRARKYQVFLHKYSRWRFVFNRKHVGTTITTNFPSSSSSSSGLAIIMVTGACLLDVQEANYPLDGSCHQRCSAAKDVVAHSNCSEHDGTAGKLTRVIYHRLHECNWIEVGLVAASL
mmetsp:Transcript_35261/g.71873  ORF Transcript_35261/g.71873 Transcript_35261/m.71873 type:complete len:208 (+) Transcript_35261:401-1024(+)